MCITDQFQTYFRFRVADNEQLKDECARLRYQVYADELGWEGTNHKKLEQDRFDPCAIHCLLEHIPSGTFAGTVRLVMPIPHPSNEEGRLPLELLCPEVSSARSRQSSVSDAEISRLAVPSCYRRRGFEQPSSTPGAAQSTNVLDLDAGARQFPLIAIGMYLGLIAVSKRIQLNTVFALMEPRLMKRLGRLGFRFEQLGAGLNHKGHRAPFRMPVHSATHQLSPEMRRLYECIDAQLTSQSIQASLPSGTHMEQRLAS